MKVSADPLRDVQSDTPVAICENPKCQGEVYSGECRFPWEGKKICLDCFKAAVTAMLDSNPCQLAYELGLDVIRYA